jgi:hypothetical protein
MTQAILQLDEMKRKWIEDSVRFFPFIRAKLGNEFCSDDLHRIMPAPPSPNHWGSLVAHLKKAGSIRKIGYKVSTRPTANCRPVSLWEVV